MNIKTFFPFVPSLLRKDSLVRNWESTQRKIHLLGPPEWPSWMHPLHLTSLATAAFRTHAKFLSRRVTWNGAQVFTIMFLIHVWLKTVRLFKKWVNVFVKDVQFTIKNSYHQSFASLWSDASFSISQSIRASSSMDKKLR